MSINIYNNNFFIIIIINNNTTYTLIASLLDEQTLRENSGNALMSSNNAYAKFTT